MIFCRGAQRTTNSDLRDVAVNSERLLAAAGPFIYPFRNSKWSAAATIDCCYKVCLAPPSPIPPDPLTPRGGRWLDEPAYVRGDIGPALLLKTCEGVDSIGANKKQVLLLCRLPSSSSLRTQ